jgi:hypothetical protein
MARRDADVDVYEIYLTYEQANDLWHFCDEIVEGPLEEMVGAFEDTFGFEPTIMDLYAFYSLVSELKSIKDAQGRLGCGFEDMVSKDGLSFKLWNPASRERGKGTGTRRSGIEED